MKAVISSVAFSLLLPSQAFVANSYARTYSSHRRTICPQSSNALNSIASPSIVDIPESPVKSVGADLSETKADLLYQDLSGDNISNSPIFYAVQGLFFLGLLALLEGGFKGEWIFGKIVYVQTESMLRAAALQVGAMHVLSAGASAAIALKLKEISPVLPFVRGLLGGPAEILRISLADDKETALERELVNGPPMQMVIDSTDIGMASTPRGFVLSTQIKCKQEGVAHMLKLLRIFLAEVQEGQKNLVSSISVNQDPEDRTNFIVIQRFPSQDAMIAHQNTAAFKEFTELSRDVLTRPMGLYLTGEKGGFLTESIYPFGPGGEGGRDDAIYSSPVNLDSSGI